MPDWTNYVETLGKSARGASEQLAMLKGAAKVALLNRIAGTIRAHQDALLEANSRDIAAAREGGLAPALIERLKLSEKRIQSMAEGVAQIAAQTDPVGQVIEGYVRPN